MKTGRDREAGEEIAKCGSFKRVGSEEEMPNVFFFFPVIDTLEYFQNKNPKCAEVAFIVSETSEQPSKQKFVLRRKKRLLPKNCAAKWLGYVLSLRSRTERGGSRESRLIYLSLIFPCTRGKPPASWQFFLY